MNKHARDCAALCDEAGLTVLKIIYGKHLKIVCKQGAVVCPSSPSDFRWRKQVRSVARRMAAVRQLP